jgi:hypothetical protein
MDAESLINLCFQHYTGKMTEEKLESFIHTEVKPFTMIWGRHLRIRIEKPIVEVDNLESLLWSQIGHGDLIESQNKQP